MMSSRMRTVICDNCGAGPESLRATLDAEWSVEEQQLVPTDWGSPYNRDWYCHACEDYVSVSHVELSALEEAVLTLDARRRIENTPDKQETDYE